MASTSPKETPPKRSIRSINKQLCAASKQGNEILVNELLAQRANVNASAGFLQFPPLHQACINGHQPVVDTLIKHAADINLRVEGGITPLLHACRFGHQDVVDTLISHAANVNEGNEQGNTPLHWACFDGHERVVNTLINHAADVNRGDEYGATPLHDACRSGNPRIIGTLISHQADIDNRSSNGCTALYNACYDRLQDLAMQLIAYGADINIKSVCTLLVSIHQPNPTQSYAYVFSQPSNRSAIDVAQPEQFAQAIMDQCMCVPYAH
jgi:ankyrin repeat protein